MALQLLNIIGHFERPHFHEQHIFRKIAGFVLKKDDLIPRAATKAGQKSRSGRGEDMEFILKMAGN